MEMKVSDSVVDGGVAGGIASSGQPTSAPLPLGSALQLMVRRAGWLGAGDGAPFASFTSLFLALWMSDHPLSQWAQDKMRWIGPSLTDVIAQWNYKRDMPRGLDEARIRALRDEPDDRLPALAAITQSPSAKELLSIAEAFARRTSSPEVEVRHAFAAYVYSRRHHAHDLRGWKFDRVGWEARFRAQVAAMHPTEAAVWREVTDREFVRTPSFGLENARRWASLAGLAARRTEIDPGLLLVGMLYDAIEYEHDKTATSVHVLEHLGGKHVVEAILPSAPSDQVDDINASLLPWSSRVAAILDRAAIFATAQLPTVEKTRVPRLQMRYVLPPLLIDPDPAVVELIQRTGHTVPSVLASFRGWLKSWDKPVDDLERWRRLFDELRAEVHTDYANDEIGGADCLAIGPDVRALAAVLSSSKVKPPLSVGLFGDWGSGKSFFMAKLRERVKQLAAAAALRAGEESWFCGRKGEVIQIEFNAWHYMDADLWSSLAVRVFDELSDQLQAPFAKACATRLASLRERQDELNQQRKALAAQQVAIAAQRRAAEQQRAQRPVTAAEAAAAAKHQLAEDLAADPTVQAAQQQLGVAGADLRRELVLATADLSSIFSSAIRLWRTRGTAPQIAAALLLGAPVVVAAIAWAYATSTQALVSILGSISLGVAAVRHAAAPIKATLAAAEARVHQIEAIVRARRTTAEAQLELDNARIAEQLARLDQASAELAKQRDKVEAELRQLRGGADKRSLQDFILQRAGDDGYRKNLGVVSAVHKDFRDLVGFLTPSDVPPNVERIILYIDDLDRCPPTRVVEVLQAVHIILSLPLFVVVVGVDSRWLLDSLNTYNRRQFPAEPAAIDTARPQQYLEKIFQIPFSLAPMSQGGYQKLVGALLPRPEAAAPEPRGRRSGRPLASGTSRDLRGALTPATPTTATARPQVSSVGEHIDLTPRGLQLEPLELAFLTSLAPLIRSPRSTKRLINLYRIVRSTLDDEALDHFLLHDGYKATQICLAIVVGHPALSAELFDRVLGGAIDSRLGLTHWCEDRHARASPRERATLTAICALSDHFAEWPEVKRAVRRVARFSFETGRILGQHLDDDAPGGALDEPGAPVDRGPDHAPELLGHELDSGAELDEAFE